MVGPVSATGTATGRTFRRGPGGVFCQMGDVVNLNKYRKERAREAEKRGARENRLRFGRTGVSKAADRRALENAEKALDGKKREEDKAEGSPDEPKPKSK